MDSPKIVYLRNSGSKYQLTKKKKKKQGNNTTCIQAKSFSMCVYGFSNSSYI